MLILSSNRFYTSEQAKPNFKSTQIGHSAVHKAQVIIKWLSSEKENLIIGGDALSEGNLILEIKYTFPSSNIESMKVLSAHK